MLSATLCLSLSCIMQAQESVTQTVSKQISDMKRGKAGVLRLLDFRDAPSQAAIAFMSALPSVSRKDRSAMTNGLRREYVAQFAIQLVRMARKKADWHYSSVDDEMLDTMVTNLDADEDPGVRRTIAEGLMELYAPKQLERHKSAISKTLLRWKGPTVLLLLYGELPSTNLVAVQNIVSRCGMSGEIYADAVLSRYGDKEAEEELVSRVDELRSAGSATLQTLQRALVYGSNQHLMKMVAMRLDATQKIGLAGGGYYPTRVFYTETLVQMNKDNPDFPDQFRHRKFMECIDIGALKKWCAKEFHIKYEKNTLVK